MKTSQTTTVKQLLEQLLADPSATLEQLRAAERQTVDRKIAAQQADPINARELQRAREHLAAVRARIEELERKAAELPHASDVDAAAILYGHAVKTQEGLVVSSDPAPDPHPNRPPWRGPGGAR